MSERTSSVFAKTLDESSSLLKIAIDNMMNSVNFSDDKSFFEFIRKNEFADPALQKMITACGNIASARPLESFSLLLSTFPENFDIRDTKTPTKISTIGFEKIINIDWTNKYKRAAIRHLINYIISAITKIMCRTINITDFINSKQHDKMKELLTKIVKYVAQLKNDDYFLDLMIFAVIDNYKEAIAFLSLTIKDETYKLAKSLFNSVLSCSNQKPSILLTLFSEASFKFESEENILELAAPVWNLYSRNDYSSQAAACLLNIFGQGILEFPNFCKYEQLMKVYKKALEYNDENSFDLKSLLTIIFSTDASSKISLSTFVNQQIMTKENIASEKYKQIVKGLLRCLYGKNYLPKSLMKFNINCTDTTTNSYSRESSRNSKNNSYSSGSSLKNHFGWHNPDYSTIIHCFNFVNENLTGFYKNNCFEDLVNFMLQVACNDLLYFSETLIHKIDNRYSELLLLVLGRILSANTGFIKQANNSNKTAINNLKNKGKTLIINLFNGQIQNNPVIYLTPSLSEELNSICTPMKHSISDIHRILMNPIKPGNETWYKEKTVSVLINRWKKSTPVFEENPDFPKELLDSNKPLNSKISINNFKFPELPFPSKIDLNTQKSKVAAIKLAPLVSIDDKDKEIIKIICSLIPNDVPIIGAAAVRSLQAFIHLNSTLTPFILDELYSQLVNEKMTEIHLFLLISALSCIIDTLGFEEIVLDKKNSQKIIKILFLGLCSPHYQIRELCLAASRKVPHSFVKNFFSGVEEEVTKRGMELAFNFISPSVKNLTSYDPIKFSSIAGSKQHFLYLFYLIAFAEFLEKSQQNSNSVKEDFIDDIRNSLFDIMANAKMILMKEPFFVANISSVLFTIWPKNQKNRRIENLVTQFKKQNLGNTKVWLSASLSSVSIDFSHKLFESLPPRAFVFYLLRCSKSQEFVKNQAKNGFSETFIQCCNKFMNKIFKSNCIAKEPTFKVDSSKSQRYRVQLYMFGEAMTVLFDAISQRHKVNTNGFLPKSQVYEKIKDDFISSKENFTFWFNLSSDELLYFSPPCQKAFAELIKIVKIPDNYFKILNDNITTIIKHTPEIAVTLFSNAPNLVSGTYLMNARNKFAFFAGIAEQLCTCNDFFERWETTVAKSYELNDIVSQIILKNIGKLLAISCFYLIGKNSQRRQVAFDFLYVSAVSIHLLVNHNIAETMKLSDDLLNTQNSFKANMAKYFTTGVNDVIFLLSKYLPFISEQFVNECFEIETAIGEKSKKKKRRSAARSVITLNHSSESLFVRKVSFQSMSTLPAIKIKENVTIDAESNEICKYVSSFIIPWTKYIFYSPEKTHIFDKCLSSYRTFSMYTFIQSLSNLKCLIPISPPLTSILQPTFKAAGEFFLTAVSDIFLSSLFSDSQTNSNSYTQTNSKSSFNSSFSSASNLSSLTSVVNSALSSTITGVSHSLASDFDNDLLKDTSNVIIQRKEKCIAMLTYAYSVDSTFVMNYFIRYLSVKFWYYHHIQISKLYQAFDLKRFLKDINEDEDSEEDLGYSTADYVDCIKFVLSLFVSFYRENPNGILPYKNVILVFCALVFNQFSEQSQALFTLLTKIDPPGPTKTINNLNYIGPYTYESIIEVFSQLDFQENIFKFLIEWGLICGDSFVASLALKILLSMKSTRESSAASFNISSAINVQKAFYALNSVYIIVHSLKDAYASRNNERQTLMKLIEGEIHAPDYSSTFSHIYYLCKLCQQVQEPTDKLINKIILTSTTLLLLPDPSSSRSRDDTTLHHSLIVTAALSNIYNFRTHLKKFKPPAEFEGYTNLILTTKLTPESLKIAEKLLLYLLKNKLSNLLIKKGLDTQILTYYAIAPFVFASETTSKTEEELNNPGIKQAFQAIATSHNIESLKNFHEAAKRNIVFESLLKFYQTILVIGTIPQIKAAVTLASLLVSDQLIGDLQILSDFSREVNKHKEYELQESVNFFLSSIMMRFAGQIRHPSNKASQQFPELFGGPKISEILEWRPKENVFDIFENVSTYPPLFLTDFSLYISNFMADLKNVMEQIKVQPYSKWGDEIFAGQIQAKPVEPVPKFDPKETETFFRTQEEIDQILKNLKKVTRAKAHKNNAHAKMSPNDDAEDEALKSCTIESSLFCPDKELIDSIEMHHICFPSIFPNK